jgi:hypothetical protein
MRSKESHSPGYIELVSPLRGWFVLIPNRELTPTAHANTAAARLISGESKPLVPDSLVLIKLGQRHS